MVKEKKWIVLNVGGTYFSTCRSTLARQTPAHSPLHRISTNSTNVHFDRDDRGAYLIDRDPDYFRVVLNYLRHGHLFLTKDTCEEGVLLEAEFFNLPELAQMIKIRLGLQRAPMGFLMNHHQQQQHQSLHHGQQHRQQQHQQHDLFGHSYHIGNLNASPSSSAAIGGALSNMLEV